MNVTAQSSVNEAKNQTAQIQISVPGTFAQVFQDADDGAMSLMLARPEGQNTVKATADGHDGANPAVTELLSSFAYFWSVFRFTASDVPVVEVEFALLDRMGGLVRPASKLVDHSGNPISIFDYDPAVAQSPSGMIGVLWERYGWDSTSATGQFAKYVFFALLDRSGELIYGPVKLTGNDLWGNVSDTRIAATGDNRFVLAWQRSHEESGEWVDDIYLAVRDDNGEEITPVSRFTEDPGPGEGYYGPGLAPLIQNRVLVTYAGDWAGEIYYAILDSAGNVVFPVTNLTSDGSSPWDSGADAAQLSNGNIVIAWQSYEGFFPRVRYAVLSPSYGLQSGPALLSGSPAVGGDGFPSVAPSGSTAVLTWMDDPWSGDSRHLYYALLDGSGGITTPPMIFWRSELGVFTSYAGYGNTTYHPWALYLPLVLR